MGGKRVADEMRDFWFRVLVGDGCWEWQGAKAHGGYGIVRRGTKPFGAHRWAWILWNQSDPGDLDVLHRCDNPPCVRPDHLFLGTAKDNAQDMKAKGRARNQHSGVTHCQRGHEFTETNTYRWAGRPDRRQCRVCRAMAVARHASQNKGSALNWQL